ncbi:HEPN domain-containing protein [Dyadobacter chenwenxiniae]|uniref:HEPN domain-containing protein n=2 Tax=Dyadobacter chenwenxiniae TaxID=2906456 RepID=A0A9X1PNB8_9BACT|nr:HEPN domain-containing protein [Dyadobacter chenwenxiniae]MCF0061656.1 HEPN domain-containing protein [Dyadobacter chenwenxiniae]UON81477.1 HEPN domain-containing protein [Dyadobacter chenwenxiniae]
MADTLDIEKIYKHWIQMSDKDFETMRHLFQSKDFHWALFVGHIVIEKLLKALVVKKLSNHAPFTHDLTRLAKLTELNFSREHLDWMDTITTFNMNTRYDSYKQLFYQKCTEEYTSEWFEKIQTLRSWIKERQS